LLRQATVEKALQDIFFLPFLLIYPDIDSAQLDFVL
jgi:hypothetical protein